MSADPAFDEDDLLPEAESRIPVPARRSREPVELVVRIKAEGMRLDHYLHMYFPDFSRSELQDAIKAGNVLVNPEVGLLFVSFERQRRLHARE